MSEDPGEIFPSFLLSKVGTHSMAGSLFSFINPSFLDTFASWVTIDGLKFRSLKPFSESGLRMAHNTCHQGREFSGTIADSFRQATGISVPHL